MAADAAKEVSNLRLRILSAVVFVPGVLLLVEATDWTLYILVLVVAARCSWEFYQILEQAGYEVLVFHATGSGGQAMESLIESGMVSARRLLLRQIPKFATHMLLGTAAAAFAL